ncbi:MAG: cytochrome-c oxidase, cbb3-type subunit II, partial [Pedobacter sp.]
MIEMMPTFTIKSNIPTISTVKPYSPLELQGRDLYIREGCVNCHSQMIRPFRSETERYGEYSKAGEFVYDHPFLWGSKRTGPDLARERCKYSNAWHFSHLMDPQTMSPGSIMPPYEWLIDQQLDTTTTISKINAMRTLGVPYALDYEHLANSDLQKQAKAITEDLKQGNVRVQSDREIIAIIAYIQRLGKDIRTK